MQKAFEKMASYVCENPVRAGLTGDVRSWPYTGCVVPGYPDLHPLNPDYWDKYWRIYAAATKRGLIGKVPPVVAEPAI